MENAAAVECQVFWREIYQIPARLNKSTGIRVGVNTPFTFNLPQMPKKGGAENAVASPPVALITFEGEESDSNFRVSDQPLKRRRDDAYHQKNRKGKQPVLAHREFFVTCPEISSSSSSPEQPEKEPTRKLPKIREELLTSRSENSFLLKTRKGILLILELSKGLEKAAVVNPKPFDSEESSASDPGPNIHENKHECDQNKTELEVAGSTSDLEGSPKEPSQEITSIMALEEMKRYHSSMKSRFLKMQTYITELRDQASSIDDRLISCQRAVNFHAQTPTVISCSICLDIYTYPHILICGHTFCFHCIKGWLINHDSCPNCRKVVLWKPSINLAMRDCVEMYLKNCEGKEDELSSRENLEKQISSLRSPWGNIRFRRGSGQELANYFDVARRLGGELANAMITFFLLYTSWVLLSSIFRILWRIN